MVGIVVVSHNKKLAEEAINLANIMKFDDFPLLNAGGLDNGELGTDAMIILEAIKKANTGDGVLVFTELGSSIINTHMALDFAKLEDIKVDISNAPLVEGLISAVSFNSNNVSLEELEKVACESIGYDKKSN